MDLTKVDMPWNPNKQKTNEQTKTPLTQTNVVYKGTCPFREFLSKNNLPPNTYVGHKTTTLFLSRRLTIDLSGISAIK